jgi:hypothetical protein
VTLLENPLKMPLTPLVCLDFIKELLYDAVNLSFPSELTWKETQLIVQV